MIYQNLNLPATLVHSVNGKKYTLNGKLLAINESTKTATMQFGDKTSNNIPLQEVYLNESALKDIPELGGVNLYFNFNGIVNNVVEEYVIVDEASRDSNGGLTSVFNDVIALVGLSSVFDENK